MPIPPTTPQSQPLDHIPSPYHPLWDELIDNLSPSSTDPIQDDLRLLIEDLEYLRFDLRQWANAFEQAESPSKPHLPNLRQEILQSLSDLKDIEYRHALVWNPGKINPSSIIGSFFDPILSRRVILALDDREILIERMHDQESEYRHLVCSCRMLADECLRLADQLES